MATMLSPNALIFLPIIGALICAAVPHRRFAVAQAVSVVCGAMTLVVALLLLNTEFSSADSLPATLLPWIPDFGVHYALQVDILAISLLLLSSALLLLIVLLVPQNVSNARAFLACVLLASAGVNGLFLAADGFLFYVFWELTLVPIYFLIIAWGGHERLRAGITFFCYTMAGSVLLLGAFLYLAWSHGQVHGSMSYLFSDWSMLSLSVLEQVLLFVAVGFALAIKIPLFPFHSWLPSAYAEAPGLVTLYMSAILSKMGIYGIVRLLLPLFPAAVVELSHSIMTLSIIGAVYGAIMAWQVADMRKIIAYASLSHLALIVFGIFSLQPTALHGALFSMVSHSVLGAGLFAALFLLEQRTGTSMIAAHSGLISSLPRLSVFFIFFGFAVIALPGLSGFVGELLVFLGTFRVAPGYTLVGVSVSILASLYMLRVFQRVFFGENKSRHPSDLSYGEQLVLLPLVIVALVLGVYPGVLTAFFTPLVSEMLLPYANPGEGVLSHLFLP